MMESTDALAAGSEGATAEQTVAAPAAPEPEPLHLHMPVDVRSFSLVVIASLAGLYTLHWAQSVFVPIVVGILCSYGLSPVVDWWSRRGVPRALSAGLLVLGIVSGIGFGVYALSDDAVRVIESLPVAAQKLRDSLRNRPADAASPLAAVQKAANQLELAADDNKGAVPLARGVQRVQIEKPKFNIQDHVWTGTMGLLALLGQAAMVALITFFLMASGDTFRRKLVGLAGPTLGRRRMTLEAVNEVHDQIQRYMMVQLFTSTLVGVATWMCFLAVGLENAAVWGVAAAILNLIPYLGSVVVTAGSALLAFLQFGTLEMSMLVAGLSLLINSVEGFLLTPWLASRAARMNPVSVFVGVLAWGWLWGSWGLLLGVPILMVIKAICDRVDDFKAVGEFIGE